ncbi:MAG: class I SAM-dependent methyltransferase [Azoarcus sp.]|nr:class I SAM-dependent methyltransferase [Azoarcus sp.]
MKVFPPHPLAFKYCTGKGIELGAALHNPFGLPDCPNVAPSDGVRFLHPRDLEDYQKYVNEQLHYTQHVARVDEVGDFQHIPFDAASLDYVISSHVIEHEPNPVAAFVESARVLKEGGIFFCIFPKRTAEMQFDIFLPLTSLDELIAAYREARTIESYPAPSHGWREHYYRYSLQSMLRLINWINREKLATFCVEAVEETDGKVGNGHTVVLRKSSPEAMPDADHAHIVETCIREDRYEAGLQAAKNALSYDFFQVPILYAAALLAFRTDHVPEAKEFYRQCLLLDPECAARRREFAELFGEIYMNPLR